MPTKQDMNGFMMLDRINLLLAKSNRKLFMVATGELCPGKQLILGDSETPGDKEDVLMDQDIAPRRSCSYSPSLIIFDHAKHSHSLSLVVSFV